MFKCLTEKGPDNREIRRPLTVQEIGAVTEVEESEVMAVIDVFRHSGRSFLTPPVEARLTAEALIDISHESLIRQWQRLRDWVEDEAQVRVQLPAVSRRCDGLWQRRDQPVARP